MTSRVRALLFLILVLTLPCVVPSTHLCKAYTERRRSAVVCVVLHHRQGSFIHLLRRHTGMLIFFSQSSSCLGPLIVGHILDATGNVCVAGLAGEVKLGSSFVVTNGIATISASSPGNLPDLMPKTDTLNLRSSANSGSSSRAGVSTCSHRVS